jgi:hypothetical protein
VPEPAVPSPDQGPPRVPALPSALADPRPVMAVGTALWAVVLVVVAVRSLLGTDGLGTTVATCAVGVALGAIGYGIFFWQRRTVRGGSGRGQQGIS